MSPSLLTEMSMFSGLVWRGMLVSFGSTTGIVCVTTGIVIRKMMSSTSITSTSGVVLMDETTSSSSPLEPTFMAMARSASSALGRGRAHPRAHQHAVQIATEAAHRFHRHFVAPDQPVVAEHRRHRDGETHGRHDQRLADRPGDLVDRGLAGDADGRQRVIDAPDGTEQAHERRRRADRGQEREAVLKSALDVVETTLHAHRDPGVVVDVLGQRAFVVLARLDAAVGDEAERAVLVQGLGAIAQRLRLEERALRAFGLRAELETLVEL